MKTVLFYFLILISAFGLHAQTQNRIDAKDSVPTITLKEVQLIGIKATNDTPITFTNISKEEISLRNLGQDIPILLNYLPSVVTTSDAGAGIGYTGIRVRGSDATRVNVTLNGIPYNDAESQGTFWVNLPDFASSVSQIQLQRGVGTSTNGSSAFGASLNVETLDLDLDAFSSIATSFGSFKTLKNTFQFSTGMLNDNFSFSGRLSQINSNGYIDRAASDLDSYFFQTAFQDDNTLIKALIFGGHEITYQSWYGIDKEVLENNRTYNPAGEMYDETGNLSGFYSNQVDDYTQNHYQFHWNEKINSEWNFSLGLNYTHGSGFYEEFNDINMGGDTTYSYLQLEPYTLGNIIIDETENISQKWLDNDYYVMTIGLNYQTAVSTFNFGGLYSRYVGDHFGTLLWGQNISNALPKHRFYENQGIKTEGSFFAKATQKISDKIIGFIDLQVRGVNYSIEGIIAGPSKLSVDDQLIFFNPKAGLTFKPSEDQSIYFSYAKAQREPNRTDYENGAPKPEKLNDFELGWRIKKEKIQVQANLYWMEYQDQLVLTGAIDEVGAPIRQNVGESRRLGIEVDASIQLTDQWLWKPNLAFSSNKNLDFYFKRDGILKNLGETQLAFSPNAVLGNAIIFAPSTGFQIGLLSKYVGKQYMGNIDAENSTLAAYFVSDLNAVFTWQSKRWVKEIQWSTTINNIFNLKYESNGYFYTYDDDFSSPGQITTIEGAGYYPQAGIHFLTGLKLTF